MPGGDAGKTKISAIIPVSRVDDLTNLVKWMDTSNLNQVEVIVVLDGLTHNDFLGFKSCLEKLNIGRLHLLYSSGRNPGSARTIGLEVATSPWVCFWDSDDTPIVNEYLAMATKAENEVLDIVVGGFMKTNDQTRKSSVHLIVDPTKSGLSRAIIDTPGIWRFLFRKSVLKGNCFPELRLGEDQIFLMKIGIESKRVGIYQASVYSYMFGSPSHLTMSSNLSDQLALCISSMVDLLRVEEHRYSSLNRKLFLKVIAACLKSGGLSKFLFTINAINRARIVRFLLIDMLSLFRSQIIGVK